jgi:Uma2 family endonuclease
VPALVVEIVSSRRRRADAAPRTAAYLKRGVRVVWTVDPAERQVLVSQIGRPTDRLPEHQSLLGEPVLHGFSLAVGGLFAEPRWWKG